MNRPWVWVAIGLATGILAAAEGSSPWTVVIVTVPPVALAWTLRGHVPYTQQATLTLVAFALGGLIFHARHAETPGDPLSRFAAGCPRENLVLEGHVREAGIILPGTDYTTFVFDVDRAVRRGQTGRLTGGVLVRWSQPNGPLFAGERIRAAGTLGRVLSPVNHGIHDLEDYYRAHGVYTDLRIAGDGLERIGAPRWSIRYWIARLRQEEGERLARAVPREILPFVLAVWLGERSRMTDAERQDYVYSGTAHILAVSGLHVGVIYASMYFLSGTLPRRRHLRIVLTLSIVVLFGVLAGARVSTLRATFMIGLYLIAEFFNREPDAPTALSLSAVVLLLLNPNDLFDGGFLLSFLSVASLLLFTPLLNERVGRVPWWIANAVTPTLAVQLLPLPIAIRFFHVFPAAAPLANLLVIPLLGAALWLCALTTAAAFVLPPAAMLFGHALLPVVILIRFVAGMAARIPYAHFLLVSPTDLSVGLYWAALVLLLVPAKAQSASRRRGLAVTALLLAALATWTAWPPPAGINVLDVGRSDAIAVRTPGRKTFLIDGGDRSEYVDMGKRVVIPFLLANHMRRVDYVVVTHPDRDHLGGLLSVVEQLTVGEVLLGPDATGRPLEQEFLALCARRKVPVRRIQRGDRLAFERTIVEVLHPPPGRPAAGHVNDNSLVLRFTWPGMTALFAGDVEAAGEQSMAGLDYRADILKVPHHGSKTSSTAEFIARAAPQIALVSTRDTGRGPGSDAAVLQRYADAGVRVWRTDWHGGLRVRRTNKGFRVDGARILRGYSLEPAPAAR
ncbi:MAG: DNA internalization-related competence protein ComEC/Rec2 [Candidatus Hydrogenedentes bacterium]|nr:DNA internalization-related competence protein ComEC/Rec2 [Candidatus Hydrogenedentota bacterium]